MMIAQESKNHLLKMKIKSIGFAVNFERFAE